MKLVTDPPSSREAARERLLNRIIERKFEAKKKFAIDFGVWLRAYSEKDTIELFEKFIKEYEH